MQALFSSHLPCLDKTCGLSATDQPLPFGKIQQLMQTLTQTAINTIGNAFYQIDDRAALEKIVWSALGGCAGFALLASNSRTLASVIKVIRDEFTITISQAEVDWFDQLATSIAHALPIIASEDALCKRYAGTPRLHALNMARMYVEAAGRAEAIAEDKGCEALQAACRNL